MYRSLEFSGRDSLSAHGAFCKLLLKSSDSNAALDSDVQSAVDIAKIVNQCTFKEWLPGPDLIPWADAFLDRDARAVRMMPNVEYLHIDSAPITKSLLATISRLHKTLKTLSIRSCTLDEELTKKQLLGLDSLRLRTVEFYGGSSMSLSPSVFRLRDLETFRTDSWSFDISALFKFLSKTPSITDLTIASVVHKLGNGSMPSLAPIDLPNIGAIRIPASFLTFFAGRPLHRVSLTAVEWREALEIRDHPTLPLLTAGELVPLIKSTASITELHIPQHVYIVLPIFKHFQHLEVLVLVYDHPNFATNTVVSSNDLFREVIDLLCTKWPVCPPPVLQELRLDFGTSAAADARPFMLNLQLQLQMLTGPLCAAFPRLTSMSAARFVKWQRWNAHSEWHAFVPHHFRELVKDALSRGRPFTDVGDCLTPLDYKH
ncbi:hypothetical protein MSAN_00138400 [Mycena sanguinolenta]|uniref:F-box domain-containing protein n=1 Tax=Mycena sanguinolenta TaxID=230812 RepID=A0A8H6ZGP2_9AGAR|nr:hypothetical protein MSAN_00138400 [Mycena sanguinolenta]